MDKKILQLKKTELHDNCRLLQITVYEIFENIYYMQTV